MNRDLKFERAVGAKIKEFRLALGWSQEYLASVANFDKKQVQRLERGDYSPYIRTVIRIAKALGKQPWELFKVDFEIKLNTNLKPLPKRLPGATRFVNKLAETNYLNSPRSVKDIVQECATRYDVTLKSSAVSGALRDLVRRKLLKVDQADIKGRFLYYKSRKK